MRMIQVLTENSEGYVTEMYLIVTNIQEVTVTESDTARVTMVGNKSIVVEGETFHSFLDRLQSTGVQSPSRTVPA